MSLKVTITGYSGLATPPVVVVPGGKAGAGAPEPHGGNQRPTLRLISGNS
jgi:hypothetical protein